MPRVSKLALIALTSVLALGHAAQAKVVNVFCNPMVGKSESNVDLTVSDRLVVVARGIPTAGYQWTSLQGFESTFLGDAIETTGGSGAYFFSIEASSLYDGEKLNFVYKRAWETTSIAECDVNVTLK